MIHRWVARGAGHLAHSPFARTIGSFMVLTALGQGIYFLLAPLIGRLFTPADVGIYGLLLTIISIASILVCLMYDYAIPVAASDEEAHDLTAGCLAIALVVAPLVGIALALVGASPLLGGQLPVWGGALATAFLLAFAVGQLLQVWRIREDRTLSIAQANLGLNLARGGSQVAGGFWMPSWWILIVGEVAGRLAFFAYLARGSGIARHFRARFDFRVRGALRRYREFPTVLLPAQLFDTIAQLIQVAGLGYLFGAAALGQYYLMRRSLDLPVAFVVRSLSDVFYARQAQDARTAPERIRPFFTRSAGLLAAVGLLGALPLMAFGRELFVFVFGPQWGEAGAMAAVMAPAAVLNLAIAPVSRVFNLTARPHLRFAFGIANLIGTIILFALVIAGELTLFQTVIGISLVTSLSYFVYFAAGWIAAAHIRPVAASNPPTAAEDFA